MLLKSSILKAALIEDLKLRKEKRSKSSIWLPLQASTTAC